VRRLLGYLRYDSEAAGEAINDLYRHELRWFQNLFLPSVKLAGKERVGSRLRRRYAAPQTPLQRLAAGEAADPVQLAELQRLRQSLDPFSFRRRWRPSGWGALLSAAKPPRWHNAPRKAPPPGSSLNFSPLPDPLPGGRRRAGGRTRVRQKAAVDALWK